jgi:periplasmic protein CpxP/Spy
MTKTLKLSANRHPLRLLAATVTLALAAGLAQTASAQPHEGHGGPGMGMMAGRHHVERMLDAVNASADQRAQIKQIMKAAGDDLRAQRESGRKLHQDMQALFTQPTVDARAAEALRQQLLAQHDQASKRMLQAMLDASRVLTPEQRQTLAEKMAQRRSMMERHRAEREATEKPAGR